VEIHGYGVAEAAQHGDGAVNRRASVSSDEKVRARAACGSSPKSLARSTSTAAELDAKKGTYVRCTNCGLENPASAVRCDCGYDFPTATIKDSYIPTKEQPPGPLAWLWPKITDVKSARSAARQGFGAAMFLAVWTVYTVLVGYVSYSSFVDAAIFALIGWRLYRMSRAAAVVGLVVFGGERIFQWFEHGTAGNPLMILFLFLAFANSIRGTFAHRQFQCDPQTSAGG